MRSEGFSFYICGSGGWPVFAWPFWRPQASASVRNRSQPSATVRLPPSWPQSCRAYGKSRKNVTFLTCQKMWSCRFAWQAWHFVTFQHVSRRVKNRFVWQAHYFCHVFFKTMRRIFCGRRSTLKTSDVIFSCWVFSANRIVSVARSGEKVQIPWQAWHFVTCHENRRKPQTKRRFCSRSIRKLVGKRWLWLCEVWKLPCLWEKSQKRVVCLAGMALCDIPRLWGARPSWC